MIRINKYIQIPETLYMHVCTDESLEFEVFAKPSIVHLESIADVYITNSNTITFTLCPYDEVVLIAGSLWDEEGDFIASITLDEPTKLRKFDSFEILPGNLAMYGPFMYSRRASK